MLLLLVIPPNENGALERVIINALNDIPEEKELIQEVQQRGSAETF